MNLRTSPPISTLILFAFFAASSSAQDTTAPTPPPDAAAMLAAEKPLEPGAAAPDFTAVTAEGKERHLSDYKGKVVVLDFWASWCAPCQEGLPRADAVARDFADKDVIFLGVDTWDPRPAFEQWLSHHSDLKHLTFVTDPSKGGWQIAHSYGVNGIPCQYIVGRDGRLVARLTDKTEADLPRILRTLIH